MEKSFTSFSPENLVYMGLLDETYSFYTDLVNLSRSEWEKWEEAGIHRYNYHMFETEFCTKIKKSFNSYLATHTSVFTDEYDTLFMSRNELQDFHAVIFSMELNTKRPGPSYIIKIKNAKFSEFCRDIEHAIWLRICNQKKRQLPNLLPSVIEDAVYSILESRINTAAEGGRKKLELAPVETSSVTTIEDVLFVFDSLTTISCNLKKHTIEAKVINIEAIDGISIIPIPVHYCTQCHKTFIGSETLKHYQSKYKRLYVTIRNDNSSDDTSRFYDFSHESQLHMLGYNVVENDMSESDRRELLRSLIENGRISYFEACRDLTQAIRLFENSPRHKAAVNKWRSDLKYIGDIQCFYTSE